MHTAPHTSGYNAMPAMVAPPSSTTAAAFDGTCISSTGASLANSHVSELEVSGGPRVGAWHYALCWLGDFFTVGFLLIVVAGSPLWLLRWELSLLCTWLPWSPCGTHIGVA